MDLTIKKLHKKYGKRKIQVYNGKKLFGEITEFCHWISLDPKERETKKITLENCMKLRKIAMENLWWLLHTDNLDEDDTEEEAWKEKSICISTGYLCAGFYLRVFLCRRKLDSVHGIRRDRRCLCLSVYRIRAELFYRLRRVLPV